MDCDYISRQAAIELLFNEDDYGKASIYTYDLESIPPADVRENVRGEWRKMNHNLGYECSECGFECDMTYYFCPNCGADMRGESDEK